MQFQLRSAAKQWLLFCIPVVASSTIAASPTIAATFAVSESEVRIRGFSHNPIDIKTPSSSGTATFSGAGIVEAEADATATFFVDPNLGETNAENQSISQIRGIGNNYLGLALSSAGVEGNNFFVEAGQTFFFDFNTILNIATSIDDPNTESVSAFGRIDFEIWEGDTWLDTFSLFGKLQTDGDQDDFGLKNTSFDGFEAFTLTRIENSVALGGNQETVFLNLQGSYRRSFDRNTSLRMVERKQNWVSARVPEPSTTFGTLLFMGAGLRLGLKRASAKSKRKDD